MKLKDREIVLGVSGGIAGYKSPEIVRGIMESGGMVSVVMTASATEFIRPITLQAISTRPVATSMFSPDQESKIGHINLVENVDAMLVAPATANIIAKAANGIADDFLSTSLLACKAQLFIAPAMNCNMWEHPAVQFNLEKLIQRGAEIIQPESGFLACGTYGTGRMAAPGKIVALLESWFQKQADGKKHRPLDGISALVTAGPTREKIDAVRYLTNFSSGKMGYAMAECCRNLGAQVCLVSGPTSLDPPKGVEFVKITSANEMHQAVMRKADQAQLIIKSAAVSDFRAANPNPQKTKKTETLTLELTKNRDILKELGEKKQENQFLVGFAAESENLQEYARKKLNEKNLDLIVANNILQPNAGFDVDTNRVILMNRDQSIELPLLSKKKVAERVLRHILDSDKWNLIVGTTSKAGQ